MINKKLIHFNTYSAFEANKSLLYDWTIAFIGETKQIYTHGNFYDCNIANIVALQEELERIESAIPTKVSQLENDKNYIENGDGYDSGVYIAVQSGKLIDPNEYDSTTETAVGVAVIDLKANFIIGLNHTVSISWGSSGTDISQLTNFTTADTARTDMNGNLNTYYMYLNSSNTSLAAGCVRNQKIKFDIHTLTGYLGSAGEWQIVLNNYEAVKSAMAIAGGTAFPTTSSLYYWTSTEYSSGLAWHAYFDSDDQYLGYYRKDASYSYYCVVPFYKINNETTISEKINLMATGYTLKSNGSDDSSWVSKTITFTNISASSWVDDTTYENYPYKCDVSCSGVTSSYYAEVVFDTAEALSGNYAPVCSTGSSIVTIYSKVNDTITIPTIFATLS